MHLIGFSLGQPRYSPVLGQSMYLDLFIHLNSVIEVLYYNENLVRNESARIRDAWGTIVAPM